MHLYLFNSDSDLALANGDENYTAPASVRKMMTDMAFLPAWYASPGTYTCAPGEVSCIHPWGWNPALVKRLKANGVKESLLPSAAQLEEIRRLAHRSLACFVHAQVATSTIHCGAPTELFSYEEVTEYAAAHPNCIFKAPISGSGRGLFRCRNDFSYFTRQWSLNTLQKQGSVIAEPLFDRVLDFAMEFYADGKGEVQFAGYSIFETDQRGLYKGNMLASNEHLESLICQLASKEELTTLQHKLSHLLGREIKNSYQGFLGVDMMICRFDTPPLHRIHPCVEINLRMNMGMVARRIYDNHICPGSTGMFITDYYAQPEELKREHERRKEEHPLRMEGRRIKSGYKALTPTLEDTKYVGYVVIEETPRG